jgi:hypothetical protein
MRTINIGYWFTTAVISFMMVFSAYLYLVDPAVAQGFEHLGFPPYFRIELAIAKMVGAALLLLPVPGRVKDWAYAGFAITFISAAVAHVASGDPVGVQIRPLVFLVLLGVSYTLLYKRVQIKTNGRIA